MITIKNKFYILLFFLSLFFLVIFFSCQKVFLYGVKPKEITQNIDYKDKVLHLTKERLDIRYLISTQDVTKNSGDMIFYFHGIGRTELDWVDSESFGVQYYNIIKQHKELKALPVVSISFGLVYVINDDLPEPFKVNLEKVFMDKLVPFFRKKLNCYGNIYFIAHSLGAFNSLTLALRHPNMFSAILAISPFIAPYSPFDQNFVNDMVNDGFKKSKAVIYKKWLSAAYKTQKRWDEYNPYSLVGISPNNPTIFLSYSKYDYPGFELCIKKFKHKIESNGLPIYFSESNRGHKSVNDELMYQFLQYINKNK